MHAHLLVLCFALLSVGAQALTSEWLVNGQTVVATQSVTYDRYGCPTGGTSLLSGQPVGALGGSDCCCCFFRGGVTCVANPERDSNCPTASCVCFPDSCALGYEQTICRDKRTFQACSGNETTSTDLCADVVCPDDTDPYDCHTPRCDPTDGICKLVKLAPSTPCGVGASCERGGPNGYPTQLQCSSHGVCEFSGGVDPCISDLQAELVARYNLRPNPDCLPVARATTAVYPPPGRLFAYPLNESCISAVCAPSKAAADQFGCVRYNGASIYSHSASVVPCAFSNDECHLDSFCQENNSVCNPPAPTPDSTQCNATGQCLSGVCTFVSVQSDVVQSADKSVMHVLAEFLVAFGCTGLIVFAAAVALHQVFLLGRRSRQPM